MPYLTVAIVPSQCPSCGSHQIETEQSKTGWGVSTEIWRCKLCNYSRSVNEGVPPSRLTGEELQAAITKLENRNGWPMSKEQKAMLEHLRAVQQSRRS